MKKKVTKKRINIKRILVFFSILLVVTFIGYYLCNLRIKNIYISNNKYIYKNNLSEKFNEQRVLEIAKLDNYPKTLFLSTSKIKNNLIKDVYIKDAKVTKKGLTEVDIILYENRPIFYNSSTSKTVLETGDEVSDTFSVPILLNYVPNEVYSKLIEKMNKVDDDILNHMSEIKYDPNNVDTERFLIAMTDGNYIYITLERFEIINKYLDIVASIDGKKGVLYLDYGNHFVFE